MHENKVVACEIGLNYVGHRGSQDTVMCCSGGSGSGSFISSSCWSGLLTLSPFCNSLFFPHSRMYSPIITNMDPIRLNQTKQAHSPQSVTITEFIINMFIISQFNLKALSWKIVMFNVYVVGLSIIDLPRWSCPCKIGMSIMAAIIWTRGLNAAVNTGPFFFTHHDIPTKHNPDPTIPCIHNIVHTPELRKKQNHFQKIVLSFNLGKRRELTEKRRVRICVCPLRTQEDKVVRVEKVRRADWMAAKKVMMAVVEYWKG